MRRSWSWEENTRGFGSRVFSRSRWEKKQKRTSNVQSRKAGPNVQLKKRRPTCGPEVASAVRRRLSVRRRGGRTGRRADHDGAHEPPRPVVRDVRQLIQ